MPRVKPTEIRLVEEMLLDEHPDATSLARDIIIALDTKRESDELYALLTQQGNVLWGYGPYPTSHAALKAAGKMVAPGPEPMPCRVVRLWRDTPQT